MVERIVLKAFFIRLLQVLWVLISFPAVMFIISIVSSSDSFDETMTVIGSFIFLYVMLIVMQYLIFASLNPKTLFDGSLLKKKPQS